MSTETWTAEPIWTIQRFEEVRTSFDSTAFEATRFFCHDGRFRELHELEPAERAHRMTHTRAVGLMEVHTEHPEFPSWWGPGFLVVCLHPDVKPEEIDDTKEEWAVFWSNNERSGWYGYPRNSKGYFRHPFSTLPHQMGFADGDALAQKLVLSQANRVALEGASMGLRVSIKPFSSFSQANPDPSEPESEALQAPPAEARKDEMKNEPLVKAFTAKRTEWGSTIGNEELLQFIRSIPESLTTEEVKATWEMQPGHFRRTLKFSAAKIPSYRTAEALNLSFDAGIYCEEDQGPDRFRFVAKQAEAIASISKGVVTSEDIARVLNSLTNWVLKQPRSSVFCKALLSAQAIATGGLE